jgi:hypothetical protein
MSMELMCADKTYIKGRLGLQTNNGYTFTVIQIKNDVPDFAWAIGSWLVNNGSNITKPLDFTLAVYRLRAGIFDPSSPVPAPLPCLRVTRKCTTEMENSNGFSTIFDVSHKETFDLFTTKRWKLEPAVIANLREAMNGLHGKEMGRIRRSTKRDYLEKAKDARRARRGERRIMGVC